MNNWPSDNYLIYLDIVFVLFMFNHNNYIFYAVIKEWMLYIFDAMFIILTDSPGNL